MEPILIAKMIGSQTWNIRESHKEPLNIGPNHHGAQNKSFKIQQELEEGVHIYETSVSYIGMQFNNLEHI